MKDGISFEMCLRVCLFLFLNEGGLPRSVIFASLIQQQERDVSNSEFRFPVIDELEFLVGEGILEKFDFEEGMAFPEKFSHLRKDRFIGKSCFALSKKYREMMKLFLFPVMFGKKDLPYDHKDFFTKYGG